MAEAVLVFIVLLLLAALAYAVCGWLGLPHPIPAIIAVIIVVLAVAYLLGNVAVFDDTAVLRL